MSITTYHIPHYIVTNEEEKNLEWENGCFIFVTATNKLYILISGVFKEISLV